MLLLRALVDPTGEEGFNSCTVSVALGGVLGGVDEFKEAGQRVQYGFHRSDRFVIVPRKRPI